MQLILASASPQRRMLLQGLGMTFRVQPSSVDESACQIVDPAKRAQVLARLKAEDIFSLHRDCWVIGCDTLVVAPDGTLLEKPTDVDDARRMLRLQSGGASMVHSGLCLLGPGGEYEGISSSRVLFQALTEAEIEWWIGTNEWRDRSGSFQIDGLGQLLIERLEGDWTSVVGLPIFLLGQLMEQAGLPLPS